MEKKSKKAFKIIMLILVIAIIAAIICYLFPVIKNLSTQEGQVAFKEKVSNSGILGFLMLFGLQFAQIFLFVIPGEPKDLFTYIAALLPIKPLNFILISTVARFPSIISSTLAGDSLLEGNWQMSLIVYGITFLIVGIAILIMRKFDKNKVTDEVLRSIK